MKTTAQPTEKKITRIDDPKLFIGLLLPDAKRLIEGYGYTWKLQPTALQINMRYRRDYDPLVINLVVVENVVTAVYIG